MLPIQKLFHCIVLLFVVSCASAQETWPSPEVEQMYRHAREYIASGDYNDAVITLKHAIALAPRVMVLYRELANTLYLSGKYSEAEQALSSLNDIPDADDLCYNILAASQAAQQNDKAAKATIKKGISRFPSSGLLYHEKGVILKEEKEPKEALEAWLDGIEHDPAYPGNYLCAAQVYLSSDKVLWGLLYGEIFVNITKDTTGVQDMKRMLFTGYKTMFDNISKDVPQYGAAEHNKPANTFIGAVQEEYASLTAVISDGITTENLTMVRTRFIMDWFSKYNSQYVFSLFSYMDELIRTGHFDIYDEWLFGKAESEEEYKAWNIFHDGDIARFSTWQTTHFIRPETRDFYNNKDITNLK